MVRKFIHKFLSQGVNFDVDSQQLSFEDSVHINTSENEYASAVDRLYKHALVVYFLRTIPLKAVIKTWVKENWESH